MIIIGICGSSGSGKSTVCKILSEMNIPVLDCDRIYHDLISKKTPCLLSIADRFGNKVIRDGALDRNALRKIVFRDDTALQELNRITHRYVLEVLRDELDRLEKTDERYAVIDAPMLFEAKLETWCHTVCAVIADERIQIDRICNRDHISENEALSRISKQIDSSVLRQKSDFVIENNSDHVHLKNECMRLLQHANSKINHPNLFGGNRNE